MKRQLVELEREIGLTTPLIAELDSRLTGQSDATKQMPSPTQVTVTAAEPASSAELSVKAAEPGSSTSVTVEKVTTVVDSGLQMESTASNSRSFQVCGMTDGAQFCQKKLAQFMLLHGICRDTIY